ncbi:serine--tRNA ligase [Roseobacter sp. MH60115]|uniref:serine--tRNA ligase n=1 Tax=Roseobacter sp. MH60115 TaxID=2785324 RepID=UPI0018A2C784|nr:serine--tRNA ligase [Roseobacter sp. MH60115]
MAQFYGAKTDRVLELYSEVKAFRTKLQDVNSQRNEIARRRKDGSAVVEDDASLGKRLKKEAQEIGDKLAELESKFNLAAADLPNYFSPDTPLGKDDDDNIEIRRFREPTEFEFPALDHLEICEKLDLVDFEAGARSTGSKFYFLKGQGVLLARALENFALDFLVSKGYLPLQTPDLARESIQKGSGFNPRGDEENIYSVAGTDLSLIGTSEITIGGYLSGKIFDSEELPLRLAGFSHCYRREAGAAGRTSKGLYRVHQFSKVEMYQVTTPEQSDRVIEEIRSHEEELYESLGLPFRVVSVCAGDLGAPAYKKYDIEAWMPGLGDGGQYGEVTSVSNCTDFQSRRLNIRFRDQNSKKPEYAYTLNGTAIAVTRVMLAILENYQRSDGSVEIPAVLRSYFGKDSLSA